MASSSAVTSPFDALPDELVLKIIKMASWDEEGEPPCYDHDWLIDILFKVSKRFKRLATDRSLWEGYVWIHADKNPEKLEFVVQNCLNSDTWYFGVFDFVPGMNSPRCTEFINPTSKFPRLKLEEVADDVSEHLVKNTYFY